MIRDLLEHLRENLRHRKRERQAAPILDVAAALANHLGRPTVPTSSGPLCGECGRFTKIEKNSVVVEELTEENESYKLWEADLYVCPECGHRVITGFARAPYAEHYQPNYKQQREHASRSAYFFAGRCRELAPAPVAMPEPPIDARD